MKVYIYKVEGHYSVYNSYVGRISHDGSANLIGTMSSQNDDIKAIEKVISDAWAYCKKQNEIEKHKYEYLKA